MPPAIVLAALAAVILWSAGPVATKIAVAELPVLVVAAGRICFGGAITLPLALSLGIPFPRGLHQVSLLVLSSLSGFVAFPILFCIGMKMTGATHGVMILALLPVMTGLITNAWERKFPSLLWWIGCGLAVIGELILIQPTGEAANLAGDALVLLSAFFLALGYVSGARLAQAGYSSQGATYWGVAIASLIMAPLLIGMDGTNVSWAAWASLAYLALGVTVAGYVLWYWALSRGGIAKVGLFQFLQPISGVVLASLLLSEAISARVVLAGVFVIGGIVTANRRQP